MPINRRRLLGLGAAAAITAPAQAGPITSLGLDAAHFGLRPGAPDDQSRVFQGAIDAAARARAPLAIAPGIYRAGNLKLPPAAQIVGVRGATQIVLSDGPALFAANGADHITL